MVETDSVVLKKKMFKVVDAILIYWLLSTLGKGCGPSFEHILIPSTQGCFVPRLVEVSPVVLEKKTKMLKV